MNLLHVEDAFEFYRDFLLWYCKWAKPRYLEIGCNRGENIWRLAPFCTKLVGVDKDDHQWLEQDNTAWYHGDSDSFFKQNTDEFDLIFIDGDHHWEQVVKDFDNALACLAPRGMIAMHDTWPPSKSHTVETESGTAYLAVDEIRQRDVDLFTFPVRYGITLIARPLELLW